MKKYLVLIVVLFLTSCFNSNTNNVVVEDENIISNTGLLNDNNKEKENIKQLQEFNNILDKNKKVEFYDSDLIEIRNIINNEKDYDKAFKMYNELLEKEPNNNTLKTGIEELEKDKGFDVEKTNLELRELFNDGKTEEAKLKLEDLQNNYPNNDWVKVELEDLNKYYGVNFFKIFDKINFLLDLGKLGEVKEYVEASLIKYPEHSGLIHSLDYLEKFPLFDVRASYRHISELIDLGKTEETKKYIEDLLIQYPGHEGLKRRLDALK